MTVKSDHAEEKHKMLKQIILNGDYDMSPDLESVGRTKKVVETILTFLKE